MTTQDNKEEGVPQQQGLRQGQELQQGAVYHVHNEAHAEPMLSQKEMDAELLDIMLKMLYNNGNKLSLSLTKDIFDKLKIPYNQEGVERIWEITINTGFVSPVIGFGNEDKMDLTTDGYKMMTQFGSYKAYLEAVNKQSQRPQIIIQADPEQDTTSAENKPEDSGTDTEKHQDGKDKS